MPISPAGALNTTALTVPNLYVQIVPPQPALNGVPTNIIGVVGGAAWGPLNTPTPFGSYAEFETVYGPLQNATYDMGTQVAIAQQQGAGAFVGVRVSDGTDAKATIAQTTDITYTALYSGTVGNGISVILSQGGSSSSSWNVTVALAGGLTEIFKNITGTGNQFWLNVASAINTGQGPLRGPSQLITATAGAGTTAPAAGTVTLTGGTNGTSGLTTADLVGTDTSPRTGMYVLEKQNASIGLLADATDSTQWSIMQGFNQAQGIYGCVPIAAGTSITSAVTEVQGAGASGYGLKIMQGDWIYWYDQVNKVTRLVSPAAFAAGKLAALDPSQSSLNKQLFGVIGTQTSGIANSNQQATYSDADLSVLFEAGIDVITNPAPGGYYWAVRGGINSSLNDAENGDNYTRLTNYIAATLNAGMGLFVGDKITPTMDQSATSTIRSFLSNLQQQGLIGDPVDPPSYTVTGGLGTGTPNPQSRTSLGYYQINAAVTYSPINRFFIVNMQGGQTVVTSQSITSPA